MENIILASESPRRKAFFELLGLPFICMPARIDESIDSVFSVFDSAKNIAEKKIIKIKKAMPQAPWIFAADTLISHENSIYGKPKNREEAKSMLNSLQSKTHKVITAAALYSGKTGKTDCRLSVSSITFSPMTDAEIEWYLDTGEWKDAAGAYKIQGIAACFITEIKGSYSGVVGLPLNEFYAMLKANGYPILRMRD